jgi:ribosomal protein S18 acetylase RimI-like enzyme
MPFSTRRATESDVREAAQLGCLLLREFAERDPSRFPLINDPPEPGFEGFLARCRLNPEYVVLVAEEEGRIVGYALGSLEAVNWTILAREHALIQDVVVDPDFRGRGIGTALVQRMVRELRTLGAERILLHMPIHNESARQMYENAGFRATMVEYYRGPEDVTQDDSSS